MAEPGEIIASRYRLDEVIGRGGMASVFRAWDLRLSRPVAVKLLRPEILADADLALRFRREAHAATVLRHPNVVACLDTGTDGDSPFLVMELIEGEDLAARLRRDPPLPGWTAVAFARDIARGLAIAHARGIVHRDVKPGNILLAADGRAMVTDFGIARLAAEAEGSLPGTTLGSVHYFSPEQARGATTTPASDVYSLGLVLFEMLTGTRPFTGATPAEIALARVDAPAPSLRSIDPAIPGPVDELVQRALAPDANDRYANGGMMADALDAVLAAARGPDTVTAPASAPVEPAPTLPAPSTAAATRPALTPVAGHGRGRRTGIAVAAAVAVFALIGTFLPDDQDPGVAAVDGTPTPEAPVTAAPGETDGQGPTPVAVGTSPDVCEPSELESCALDPGTYSPSRFDPTFSIELDDGWSIYRHASELIVFERPEGYLTLASGVSRVHDRDEVNEIDTDTQDLLDAIRDNGALEVFAESGAEVGGREATELQLVTEGERAAIFSTGEDTFYAETTTVTRLLVLEVDDTPVIVILEGSGDGGLPPFEERAESALASLSFD